MATMINMPKLSPTMEEGVLAKWTKKVGDKISPGDVIAEVETDKANMDFPLEDEGVLLRLLVAEGDTVKLGAPVAILGEAGESADAVPAPMAPKIAAPPVAVAVAAPQISAAPNPTNGRVKASPLARKLAREQGLDLHAIAGSGPFGRIVQRDLAAVTPAMGSMPLAAADVLVAPSQMRKTIAKRLTEAARDIPHIYLTADATVDRLLDLREQTNEALQIKISVNDLIVKALALALARVPDANVSFTDAGIVRHSRVDIGVAVSVPDGLITPVIRGADKKGLGAISSEVRDLAARAKVKKLRSDEYTGATASVSNLGMYGVREFTAIINPPEAVILAVGATEKRAIVVTKNGTDEVRIARRMTLTLSCDHRVVDGVLGAKLLAEIVRTLENPLALSV